MPWPPRKPAKKLIEASLRFYGNNPYTDEAGTPILMATTHPFGLKVYCEYCHRWHYHGSEPGFQTAGCQEATNSPYRETGYILKVPA